MKKGWKVKKVVEMMKKMTNIGQEDDEEDKRKAGKRVSERKREPKSGERFFTSPFR